MNFIQFLGLPVVFIAIGTIITTIVTGGLYFAGLFTNAKQIKQTEQNKIDDRVIQLLKEQVDALERKVTSQEEQINQTTLKLQTLELRNKIIEEIFQGKDIQTIEFQKQGFEAMKVVPELLKISHDTNKHVESLYQSIESLIKKMPKDGEEK